MGKMYLKHIYIFLWTLKTVVCSTDNINNFFLSILMCVYAIPCIVAKVCWVCNKMPFESLAAFVFMFSCIDGSTNQYASTRARKADRCQRYIHCRFSYASNAPAQCAHGRFLTSISQYVFSLFSTSLWRFFPFVLDFIQFLSFQVVSIDSSTVVVAVFNTFYLGD